MKEISRIRSIGGNRMEIERPHDNHRRFLKGFSPEEYKLGAYFPEKLILLAKSEPTSFQWLRSAEYGSVVFLMSAHCSACHMGPIQEFVENFRAFNYCVLFEGSDEVVEMQREVYDIDIPFYISDPIKLQNQLHVGVMPFALVLNKIGQVVGAGIFNDYEKLKRLANPLIQVYENSLIKQ